jgi:hypothetical protein
VAVIRLKMRNEDFAEAAISESWSPDWFIGVCDGCAGFGRNDRCENETENVSLSIPLRLATRFWVTDHFSPDEVNALLRSRDPSDPRTLGDGSLLRQRVFLSEDWDSSNHRNGTRIFEVSPPRRMDGRLTDGDEQRRAP